MYDEMFTYVQNLLKGKQGGKSKNKIAINYDRFAHTKRVFKWVKYLCDELKVSFDRENLYVAAIFHDAGYSKEIDLNNHAKYSSEICKEYLISNTNFDNDKIEYICNLIVNHSDKSLLYNISTSLEMIILLEADVLDDTGAMGLVIDTWIKCKDDNTSFEEILDKMKKHIYKKMVECPIVTEPGKRIWNEKLKLTRNFIKQYEFDIEI
ncbi:MAG: HD domain-containing protein [Clostridiales bacterium]|nr:HD domain-containing protein [Clostridiales bacterium]MDY2729472.1 HD domain-containing protein [Clostridium sp.]